MKRLIFIIAFGFILIFQVASSQSIKKQQVKDCSVQSEKCADCSYAVDGNSTGRASQTIVLSVLVALVSAYLYKTKKRKYYAVAGALVVTALLVTSFVPHSSREKEECIVLADALELDEFVTAGDEFISLDESGDDFTEFKTSGEEFSSIDGDEFIESGTEFSAISNDEFAASESNEESTGLLTESDKNLLIELGVLLLLTIVVGLMVNNTQFQKLRPFFLLAMLVWLGFIKGGCPCMISSFQNLILFFAGLNIKWISLLWFLGLIPLTYFFGRVWCGWLCHLGAFQEFIYSTTKLDLLKKEKHQKVLRFVQIALFALLILQLIITKTNIYIHYDPFKVAFNLFSANVTGYVLLVVLLLSSVLIYRPFCRSVCPVGLVLGWVSLIPGARRISKNPSCIDCVKCSRQCKSHALLYENKKSMLDVSNCIACGDCLDSCSKDALSFTTLKKV
nr:4Fe-4S binding protein [uncultured Carboxylicivirga sp.]